MNDIANFCSVQYHLFNFQDSNILLCFINDILSLAATGKSRNQLIFINSLLVKPMFIIMLHKLFHTHIHTHTHTYIYIYIYIYIYLQPHTSTHIPLIYMHIHQTVCMRMLDSHCMCTPTVTNLVARSRRTRFSRQHVYGNSGPGVRVHDWERSGSLLDSLKRGQWITLYLIMIIVPIMWQCCSMLDGLV